MGDCGKCRLVKMGMYEFCCRDCRRFPDAKNPFDMVIGVVDIQAQILMKSFYDAEDICGIRYIIAAAELMILNPDKKLRLSTEIYPAIADQYGTNMMSVEHDIRYAIRRFFDKGDKQMIMATIGVTYTEEGTVPSNHKFLKAFVAFLMREEDVQKFIDELRKGLL